MKIATLSRILLLALILTSASGCATHALWSNETFDEFNEPAPDSRLSLYSATSKSDFLVVYDEISGRNESIHRRAYWLKENQRRTEKRERPVFVNKKLSRNLANIPVYSSANAPAPGQRPKFCAVLLTNDTADFILFSGDIELGSHLLPVYDDGKGQAARIALTPLTITVDAAIVGGFVGYLYLESMGNNGDYYDFH